MAIEKIDHGKWLVRYSKRNPKTGQAITRRKIVATEAGARRKEREFIAAVERVLLEKSSPKWGTMIDEYVQHSKAMGLAEIYTYNAQISLDAATRKKWGNLPISEITTLMIIGLVKNDYKDHAETTRKALLKFVRAVFKYAQESGQINYDPTPRLAFRLNDKLKKVLTEDQARTLLTAAKSMDWPWYPHYAAALYTGMRNGELYALTWDQVDLENRRIVVNKSWCKRGGFKSTKSGDDRLVEIAPNLLHVLKELKILNGPSNFVLPHMHEWQSGDQARELRRFLIGIGLPEIRFHDLRASWATMMLSKGIPPVKVMMMGGWKDMKTMMIYMRKAGIDTKGIADCLNFHDPEAIMGKVLNF